MLPRLRVTERPLCSPDELLLPLPVLALLALKLDDNLLLLVAVSLILPLSSLSGGEEDLLQKSGLSLLLENSGEIELLSSNGTWVFRETALTLWDLRREAAEGGGALGSVAAPLLEVDLKEAVAIFMGLTSLNSVGNTNEEMNLSAVRFWISFLFFCPHSNLSLISTIDYVLFLTVAKPNISL